MWIRMMMFGISGILFSTAAEMSGGIVPAMIVAGFFFIIGAAIYDGSE